VYQGNLIIFHLNFHLLPLQYYYRYLELLVVVWYQVVYSLPAWYEIPQFELERTTKKTFGLIILILLFTFKSLVFWLIIIF